MHRIIDRLGPFLALAPARRKYGPDTVVDRRRHPRADPGPHGGRVEQELRYSTNMQVMIDAATRLVVAVGQPQPGNRNDCVAYSTSKIDRAAAGATVLADGGYQGTGVLIPRRHRAGKTDLPGWKERDNAAHRKLRARVEHTFTAHEDLQDPPGLPPPRPRRLLGHHRSRPPAQPRPHRLTHDGPRHQTSQRVTRHPLVGLVDDDPQAGQRGPATPPHRARLSGSVALTSARPAQRGTRDSPASRVWPRAWPSLFMDTPPRQEIVTISGSAQSVMAVGPRRSGG